MMVKFVREQNFMLERFVDRLNSMAPASQRGLVGELAFLAFCHARRAGLADATDADEAMISKLVDAAYDHVASMRAYTRRPPPRPDETGVAEALDLANRIGAFCAHVSGTQLVLEPRFAGCGWLSASCGDLIVRDTNMLVEIKTGGLKFRGIDYRQTLTYCALNFAEKLHDIDEVCLVNARLGVYGRLSLEELCQRTAGRSSIELLSDIVDYVSEPVRRYGV